MTRITSFGIKRTHVEAGFSNDAQVDSEKLNAETKPINDGSTTVEKNRAPTAPPRKKRKRTKMSMRDNNTGVKAAEAVMERERKKAEAEAMEEGENGQALLSKSAKKRKREKHRKEKVLPTSEHRREKRIQDKLADTTCFACRKRGHAAKDCPVAKNMQSQGGERTSAVGICYRCGSNKHILSQCKKPVNQDDPLPFASCFVCMGKGHLASSCPQNKEKGVYPDGGCCKLCGDTSHLARDCGLRKHDVVDASAILGTGNSAGADEDDFHSFKRQSNEVDRDQKREAKMERSVHLKQDPGVMKASWKNLSAPPKKVVHF